MSSLKPEDLYTKKTSLYQFVFIYIFRYGNGIRNYFSRGDLLKSEFKVLDAGCGSGTLTRALTGIVKKRSLANINFHCFDLTQAMLNLFRNWIKEQQITNVTLLKANALNLQTEIPSVWSNYDLIVSSAMLEYIPPNKLKKVLSDFRELLKDNGTFCLFISRKTLLMSLLIKWWWKANLFEKNELQLILLEAGFTSIQFKKFRFPYSYLNCWGFIIEAKK